MSTQGAGPRIEPVAHLAAGRRANHLHIKHVHNLSFRKIFCPPVCRLINGIIVKYSAFLIDQILLDDGNISSEDLNNEAVLRIRDVYPGSRISDPASNNSNKRGGGNNLWSFRTIPFCSHKVHKIENYFF